MKTSSVPSSRTPKQGGLSLRWLAAPDVPTIRAILLKNRPVFSDEECRVAVEMIEDTLAGRDGDPYHFLVAELETESGREVVGYTCFGPVCLTKGTFDLYWIAVDPDRQGFGIGDRLLRATEDEIVKQGGGLVVAETSGRADYESTRRFYEKTMAYELASRVRDFYKPGDDRIDYVKHLPRQASEEASAAARARNGDEAVPVVDLHPHIAIRSTPGRGRGVFAKRDFAPGDEIEVAPVYELSIEESRAIRPLDFHWNMFEWKEHTGDEWTLCLVYGSGSLFNHSYSPNAHYDRDYKRNALVFTAIRPIAPGEEIFINYNGDPECQDRLWFDVV